MPLYVAAREAAQCCSHLAATYRARTWEIGARAFTIGNGDDGNRMAGMSAAMYEPTGAECFVVRMGCDNDDRARRRFPLWGGGELRLPVAVGSPCPCGVHHSRARWWNSVVIEHARSLAALSSNGKSVERGDSRRTKCAGCPARPGDPGIPAGSFDAAIGKLGIAQALDAFVVRPVRRVSGARSQRRASVLSLSACLDNGRLLRSPLPRQAPEA